MKFTAAFLSLLSLLPSPVRGIADQVGHEIVTALDQDDLNDVDGSGTSRNLVVRHTNTERIVLHFASMNIADSCVLTTKGLSDVKAVQEFSNHHKFNNRGPFWAFSVESDIVTLTLACSTQTGADATTFAIDKYAVTSDTPSVLSICGTDEKVNAICYKDDEDHPDIYDHAKKACRVIINGGGACTGWLVGISNSGHSLLLTNEHCINNQNDADNSSFQFMAEKSECPGSTSGSVSADNYSGKTLLSVDAGFDYALIELEPNSAGDHAHQKYGYFELDARAPVVGEKIYIPQHAGGRLKQLGIEDTNDSSGVCTVLSINQRGCTSSSNVDMRYTCDTEGGSSGSPVVLYDTNKIIGLHHCGGGCGGNMGVMISGIAPLIQDYVDPQPTAAPVPTLSPTGAPSSFCDGEHFRLTLKTDQYSSETDFTLVGDDNVVYMSLETTGVTLGGNTEYDFEPVCLAARGYTFTMLDSFGDGICCQWGNGFYKYTVGEFEKEGSQFTNEDVSTFNVVDSDSSDDTTPTLSPVTSGPCDHLFKMTVQIDDNGGETSYELRDEDEFLIFSDGNLSSGDTVEEEACLSEGIKYTYKIMDQDGICCSSGSGSYALTLNDKLLAGGGEFEEYEKVTLRI